jgi:hypothetical protein
MWNGNAEEPLIYRGVAPYVGALDGGLHYAYETGYTTGVAKYSRFDPIIRVIVTRIAKKVYDDSVARNNFWSNYYQCINDPRVGRSCYSSTQTQPDMQMKSISGLLYARKYIK